MRLLPEVIELCREINDSVDFSEIEAHLTKLKQTNQSHVIPLLRDLVNRKDQEFELNRAIQNHPDKQRPLRRKLNSILQGQLISLYTELIFWLGGLIVWLLSITNWNAVDKLWHGISLVKDERLVTQAGLPLWDFLQHIQEPEALLAMLMLVAMIMLSGIVVKTLQFRLLRFSEGYGWFSWLHNWRVNYHEKQYQTKLVRWSILNEKYNVNSLTPAEKIEYARLDKEMVYSPDSSLPMPTRLGNILRSYEQRPREKYGLDVIICWERLWLLLPKEIKKELTTACTALDEAIQVMAWGFLFLIWMVWIWWLALLIAVLLIWGGYLLALQTADIYGQLLEATFDVHRHLLYQSLRWKLPENSEEEKIQGKALTSYLWRGEYFGKFL